MKLLERHHQILDLFVGAMHNCKEIAEIVGVTPQTIYNIKNSTTFQHELAMRRKNTNSVKDELVSKDHADFMDSTRRLLHDNSLPAAKVLVASLFGKDPSMSVSSAKDILDRTGFPKQMKQENVSKQLVVTLDGADLTRLRETMELERED